MGISRRDFLKYCTASAAILGLGVLDLQRVEAALKAGAPSIIWLHGAGCQGDSVSFLNRMASSDPAGTQTAEDILINSVNLAYHTVLMAGAGQTAVTMLNQTARKGGYVLVLEGAIPRAFGGQACMIYEDKGQPVTIQQAVANLAPNAAAILCVGTCASFGGIPRSGPNFAGTNGPTDVISGSEATQGMGKLVINIAGCPAHPDWVAWTVVQLILGNPIPLDANNRPTALYGGNIHENCPRNPNKTGTPLSTTFGQDNHCLEPLGCRGPLTFSDCPSRKWNNGGNWCVDANAMCIGCVESNFPAGDFYIQPY